MTCLLALSLALPARAGAPETPAAEPPLPAGSEAPVPAVVVPQTPEELLDEARSRARRGDHQGARLAARAALALPGDHQRTAQYLEALALELGGQPALALEIWDALVAADWADGLPDDVAFRRAECLGRLGRVTEARRQLAALGSDRDRDSLDRLKLDVLEGTWTLAEGRERRGLKQLRAALDEAPEGVGTWYQASGRRALLDLATTQAAALRFEGSDGAKRRALERRAALLEVANEQLVALVRLEEPAWSLGGFVAVGDAWLALGQDLLDESPLVRLTEEQRAINRAQLEERVEKLWVRASQYYDRGLQLAARHAWTDEPVPTLRAGQAEAIRRVDALAAARTGGG